MSAVAFVESVESLGIKVKREGTSQAVTDKLIAISEQFAEANLQVGIFETARYDKKNGKSVPVAGVAAVHELGSKKKNIPARPHVRPAAEENQGKWRDVFLHGAERAIAGEESPAEVMNTLGLVASGDIRAKITEIQQPALHESTKKRKGSSKPLIESKLLLKSYTHRVGPKPDDSRN